MRVALIATLVLAGTVAVFAGEPPPAPTEAEKIDSPETAHVQGAKATLDELVRCEEIAAVSTGDLLFFALCRGAGYAFDLAEPEGERSGDFAERGLKLADRARQLRPERVEGHYRYAICLGVYLREHSLAGLTRVRELIKVGKKVVELDERYEKGGGHRLLAEVYSEAPGFVGGDKELARKHLARLLEVAGDDWENRVVAVRVHHELGDKAEARAALAELRPQDAPDETTRKARQAEVERLREKIGD